jgi:hypothetical protein
MNDIELRYVVRLVSTEKKHILQYRKRKYVRAFGFSRDAGWTDWMDVPLVSV